MIVGSKDIDQHELLSNCKDITLLRDYCVRLVPRVLRHNMAIMNNQKYLVALYVRNFHSIPYATRKDLCEQLLEGVSVTGLVSEIYDYEDLIMSVDIEKIIRYVKEIVT